MAPTIRNALIGFAVIYSACVFAQAPQAADSLFINPAVARVKHVKKSIKRIEKGNRGADRENAALHLDELMEKYEVPGLSIAVVQDFQILWAKGYGYADEKNEIPITTNTLFQAGSIGKPVAAMGVLRAVQDEKFSLDDDVNDLLVSWKLPENELTAIRKVTPRMLLSHTGGTSVGGFYGYKPGEILPNLPQILSGIEPANSPAVVVDLEPFTEWRYSGGGTTIMQLALMDVYNQSFEDIFEENIFIPIGMTRSTFSQPLREDWLPLAARAHAGRENGPWLVYPELAAAGLWSTPTDLAKFIVEMQSALHGEGGHVLNREMAKAMITPALAHGDYGLGFGTWAKGPGRYFSHVGKDWGFASIVMGHHEEGYASILMTNGHDGNEVTRELLVRIAVEYEWDGEWSAGANEGIQKLDP